MMDTNSVLAQLNQLCHQGSTITYKALADQLGITPPKQIQQLTNILEALQEDDAILQRPQRTALVVQKGNLGIPRAGFFQRLRDLGLYQGSDQGLDAQMWHQHELERLFSYDAQ